MADDDEISLVLHHLQVKCLL